MFRNSAILLFVKAPLPGQVKSRLAAVLGNAVVLELYRNFVLDLLQAVDHTGLPSVIFHHPPDAAGEIADWLGSERIYKGQQGKDVGERMEQAFRDTFSGGCSRVVLIGSDIPDLPCHVLAGAFDALERHDAVIGPAEDGGYYLIGFRRETFLPEVFRGIPWSTNTVFQLTIGILERAGQTVHHLARWRDVDTTDDLRDLMRRNLHTPFASSRTMRCLGTVRDLSYGTKVSHA